MSNHFYILHAESQQHRDRFLTALSCWSGFVCFGNPFAPDFDPARPPWLAARPTERFLIHSDNTEQLVALQRASETLPGNARLAGMFDYEAGSLLEPALRKLAPESGRVVIAAGLYLWWLQPIAGSGWAFELHLAEGCKIEVVDTLTQLLEETAAPVTPEQRPLALGSFHADEQQARFERNVNRILDYIRSGDCYQVNLSQRFRSAYSGPLWQAYSHLISQFPTGHAAYLTVGPGPVLSISPESFLEINGDQVVTQPIKGTRPRGSSDEEDRRLAAELSNSLKDRAENVMIVDLLRNDLGRFCVPGSIRADKLMALESYRNVHHLVSTVSGRLAPGHQPLAALCQAFPGGSITGAPKIRAMEIIAELELTERGPYCGSAFYLTSAGDLYSNIAIRTLYGDGEYLYCHGGGGIVADSDPGSEYQETLDKIGPMMKALERRFGQA
ncbi:anthranilate synthase component I family protein [Marinobacter sp. SS21]|uniref:anthranilate synthase component I family protein n=1 Tax=Marinobacter sp. SS21 TaxID=2979460 RepID=UPI0023301405|nr:anthranilate synthase component I family protein [Marinobacter sp. SS21]MDC0661894.1 anthranilate synthase component I family protein [Marinobacter sp. SS21]